MKSFLFSIVLFIILPYIGFSQSLNAQEINGLHIKVFGFLSKNNIGKNTENRQSEFTFCFLDIDSNGKVSDIHLLADDENKDLTFTFLKEMKPNDFVGWESKKCKGKTIILPVYTWVQNDKTDYLKKLETLYPLGRLTVLKETDSIVSVDAFWYRFYSWEKEIHDEPKKYVEVEKGKDE